MIQLCIWLFSSLVSFVKYIYQCCIFYYLLYFRRAKRLKKKAHTDIRFVSPMHSHQGKKGLNVQSCFNVVPSVYVINLLGKALGLSSLQSLTWLRGKNLGCRSSCAWAPRLKTLSGVTSICSFGPDSTLSGPCASYLAQPPSCSVLLSGTRQWQLAYLWLTSHLILVCQPLSELSRKLLGN